MEKLWKAVIFIGFLVCCLHTSNALSKNGANVCTTYVREYITERYCAYTTWRSCCVWRYRSVCRYREEYSCCSGYRTDGGTGCPTPICSTNCGGSVRGTCIAPETCRCNSPYNGDTCEGETCSNQRPCYPGVCQGNSGSISSCTCNTGFTLQSTSTGCVGLSIAPVITLATGKLSFYDTMKQMDTYNLTVDASVQSASEIWTNLNAFNTLTAHIVGILELPTLPGRPPYVTSAAIGISGATMTYQFRKRDITITDRVVLQLSDTGTVQCQRQDTGAVLSNTNPQSGVLTCNQFNYTNFNYRIDSYDELTLSFTVTSGGQQVLSSPQTINMVGTQSSTSVKFLFDLGKPTRPVNGEDIFHVDKEITKESSIVTRWLGWSDAISGMATYNWEIFLLEKNGQELREQGQKYLSPIFSQQFNETGSMISFTYKPPQPGVYSLILEAADLANNTIYAQRYVIFDPVSNVSTTSTPLKSLTGYANTSYQWQSWQTGSSTTIRFGWEGHFVNILHNDNAFLGVIQDYPPQLRDELNTQDNTYKKTIDKTLVDPTSTRTQAAISNVNGIVRFEVASSERNANTPTTFINKSLALTHDFTRSVTADGDFVRLWARAYDAMGNTNLDTMLLGFDNSAPDINEMQILPNSGTGFTYTSRLSFKAYDIHSGIDSIDYTFIEKASGNITAEGTIPANVSLTAPLPQNGYTLNDGSYFNYQHLFPINNCWLKVSREESGTKTYTLQLTIKNRAMLVQTDIQEIGDLSKYDGIGTYQGMVNMTVISTFAGGVRLGWNFVDSCYIRESITLKYSDPDGTEHTKTVYAEATRFDINNLQPSTPYNVTMVINYDLGTSDQVVFQFVTSNQVLTLAQTGMTTGSIVGAVFGLIILVLILVILFMGLMIRKGRLQKVNAVVVEPLQRTIRRKRDPGGAGYMQYKTGGYDVEDIYMYGGIKFDEKPEWQYSSENLTLGNIIKVGRFARIYKATLKTHGKTRTVVAKTLKDEYNEEDSILMKAKINFFGTKVGNHSCVMGFIGSVDDDDRLGPVMLLEYCENGPLKEWLTEHKNQVNDDVMERLFRFSYDIARGMEFLASKEIIHMRLAARNILLTDNLEAKIAGFGPRQGDGDEENETEKRERIPVKWIAPECLDSSKSASEKSDVWSYGITIWEIFSMGQSPYSEVRSKELPRWLKKGNRLQKPEYADDLHHNIMKECWHIDPIMRPPFSRIHKEIEALYKQESGDQYYYEK